MVGCSRPLICFIVAFLEKVYLLERSVIVFLIAVYLSFSDLRFLSLALSLLVIWCPHRFPLSLVQSDYFALQFTSWFFFLTIITIVLFLFFVHYISLIYLAFLLLYKVMLYSETNVYMAMCKVSGNVCVVFCIFIFFEFQYKYAF